MCSAHLCFSESFFPLNVLFPFQECSWCLGWVSTISSQLLHAPVSVWGRDGINCVCRWSADKWKRNLLYSRPDSLWSALLQHQIVIAHVDVKPNLFPARGVRIQGDMILRVLLPSMNRIGTGAWPLTAVHTCGRCPRGDSRTRAPCWSVLQPLSWGVLLLCCESVEESWIFLT